jgi:hypothetical protein
MSLRVWYQIIYDADATTGTDVAVNVKPLQNFILTTARVTLIGINDPTFTSATLKIYSTDENLLPKKLIHSSTTTKLKSDFITDNSGVYDLYFEFDSPSFKENETYSFIVRLAGYTYSTSSHLGWKKDFPDPVYKTNQNYNSSANAGSVSKSIQLIGKAL